jgi:glycosyltransferase involved in cell wall biosynthesis
MRILIFLPALTLGGAERQGFLVARYLKGEGHRVEVWGFPALGSTGTLVPELQRHGLCYHQLPSWPHLDWRFADSGVSVAYFRGYCRWIHRVRALAGGLPRRKFDVVIPFTFWPSLTTCLVRERLGAPRHYWTQRGGYDDAGIFYNRFLIRQILTHRPQFLANSEAGAKFLRDKFQLSSSEVGVIPNTFIDDHKCGRLEKVRAPSPTQTSLIHVANFYPEKDYDTVLRAIQILNSQSIPIQLNVCGAFLSAEGRVKFFERVRELKIENSVIYHGAVARTDVFRLLLNSDIGLLSSKSEGQPNAVMEYMHAGLPVIATRIPGVREIVGEENEKYLFEVGDSTALARLINSLRDNPALRAELGRRNRNRLVTHFAPEQVLPRWSQLVRATNLADTASPPDGNAAEATGTLMDERSANRCSTRTGYSSFE